MASSHTPFFQGMTTVLRKVQLLAYCTIRRNVVHAGHTILLSPSHGVLLKAKLRMFGCMAVPPHNTYTIKFL